MKQISLIVFIIYYATILSELESVACHSSRNCWDHVSARKGQKLHNTHFFTFFIHV